jgi:hypothetical protein
VTVLAAFLAVDRSWIYAHANELGAWRLGSGPKARLRFDLEEVRRRLSVCPDSRTSQCATSPTVEPNSRSRRSTSLGSGIELLPIRGRNAA